MYITKITSTFLLLSSCFLPLKSQELIKSPVYIQTCIDKVQCFSVVKNAFLFYDENREELYLKIDFKKVKEEKDSLYYWLDDLSCSNLLFKTKLSKMQFPAINSSHAKLLRLTGLIYFNSILVTTSVDLTILATSENSFPQVSTHQNNYNVYRISFGFSFLPKEFKIHNKPHHLKKTISIGISAGIINLLLPGMYHLVEDIYGK